MLLERIEPGQAVAINWRPWGIPVVVFLDPIGINGRRQIGVRGAPGSGRWAVRMILKFAWLPHANTIAPTGPGEVPSRDGVFALAQAADHEVPA